MLQASCHCGSIKIDIPRKPRTLTSCNCSICRRTGGLWAYYKAAEVRVHAPRGSTDSYVWGDRALRLIRCATCGCVTHWTGISQRERMGVNCRNLDPEVTKNVRIRRFDGASTWKFLD